MDKGEIKLLIGFAIIMIGGFFLFKSIYKNDDTKEVIKYKYVNSEDCECECDSDNIRDMLYDITINPDDYTKADIIRKIKEIY